MPALADMTGKIALVTGATSGIGQAAAHALAAMGATVIVAGRSRDKAQSTAAAITAQGGRAEIALADLATLAGARALAADVLSRFDRLDVLLNNAGGMFSTRQVTADGLEMTFALNHMSYFVVTRDLLPLLRRTPGARVVSVSSDAHQMSGQIDFDDLQAERAYGSFPAYSRSKLANILFTVELARRLRAEGAEVTANAMHPGFVATNFFQGTNGIAKLIVNNVVRPFMRTSAQGADTAVWLAAAPEAAGQSGGYYVDRRLKQPSAAARSAEAAQRLWTVSEEIAARA